MGTLNLLQAVKNYSADTRVLYVSSSEVYGATNSAGEAHDETSPLAPGNPYAASKAAADLMAQQYARNGLDVIVARPFNHTGPGQLPSFALPAFAKQIALIESGQQEPVISVGNLEVERDFLDVRDVVAAYSALISASDVQPGGVYNVCSGEARNLKKVLHRMIEISGTHVEIEVDPEKFRPSDAPVIFGANARLKSLTGWQPSIDWEGTLRDLLDDARRRLSQ
jgi:nucleoside-diphosphate-sugar epimerase